MPRREVPHGAIVLILDLGPTLRFTHRFGGACIARHDGGFVAGIVETPVFTATDGAQEGVQVMFTPAGAGRLLGLPVAALGGAVQGVGERIAGLDALSARLRDTRGWPARFAVLEAWLHARAAAAREVPRELALAWDALRRGGMPVARLASALGWSERRLARRFTAEFGLPPKRAARLLRFDRARQLLGAGVSAAEAAARCGYADQPHLAREVRAFSGLTPAALHRATLPDEGGLGA
ncbi:MAG: helix-turn-helix domain-containing protein [Acetobacteraceae bacterium]